MELNKADSIAIEFMARLRPSCDRIDVVGSISRRERFVTDADIILIPSMRDARDMFGMPTGQKVSMVDDELQVMWEAGILSWCKDKHGNDINGPKHKKMALCHHSLKIELWLVTPPAQWGVIKLLRTGPADFSHQVVTKRDRMTGWLKDGRKVPGLLPSNARMDKGQVLHQDVVIPMPEEMDFFRYIGLAWIPPESRRAGMLDTFVKWPNEKLY